MIEFTESILDLLPTDARIRLTTERLACLRVMSDLSRKVAEAERDVKSLLAVERAAKRLHDNLDPKHEPDCLSYWGMACDCRWSDAVAADNDLRDALAQREKEVEK